MTKRKILVAEDDKAIVEVVKIILESEGYEVLFADQGVSIHQTVKDHNPDIIFMDIWLFGENGGEIAKQIKAKDHSKHIPLIMMSANNETEKITKETGADGFLLKPFNIEDLIGTVKKHVKS